nr:hypothetical protein [Oceanispirochaeta sp.]
FSLPRLSRKDVLDHNLNRNYRCILGRETSIQNVEWVNDWPFLSGGGRAPSESFEIPDDEIILRDSAYELVTDFEESVLPLEMQTLRLPFEESVMSLTRHKGFLTLSGRDSPGSKQFQTVVGIRQKHFNFTAKTSVEFSPVNFQQMAGLMYRYNEDTFYYINITFNEDTSERVINLMVMDNGSLIIHNEMPIASERVFMKIHVNLDKVMFYYSIDENSWISLGNEYDATIISDEYIKPYYGFTGAFICLACHDWSGQKLDGKFDFFNYKKL